MTFEYPLQGGNFRLSHSLGRFGRRKGTPHNGVDLYASSGTPVLAVLDGVVGTFENSHLGRACG